MYNYIDDEGEVDLSCLDTLETERKIETYVDYTLNPLAPAPFIAMI